MCSNVSYYTGFHCLYFCFHGSAIAPCKNDECFITITEGYLIIPFWMTENGLMRSLSWIATATATLSYLKRKYYLGLWIMASTYSYMHVSIETTSGTPPSKHLLNFIHIILNLVIFCNRIINRYRSTDAGIMRWEQQEIWLERRCQEALIYS